MAGIISRKVLLINKPFQYSIIGWFFFFSLILIAIFYGSIWYFFNHLTAEAIAVGLPPGHVFFRFVDDQKNMMNNIFLFSCVLSLITIILAGLYISNKVAGPVYRITQYMLKHSIHDVKPVSFRQGDYFMELQDAFNDFLKRSK